MGSDIIPYNLTMKLFVFFLEISAAIRTKISASFPLMVWQLYLLAQVNFTSESLSLNFLLRNFALP